jgi:nucleoside-diphosphate-sugar epimerase
MVKKPLPADDPKVRRPDITRATKLLGWTPKVPLEAGLEKTVRDFRARLGMPAAN